MNELTAISSDAQAIIDAARLGENPAELELGKYYAVRRTDGQGIDTIDLTGDQYRAYPRRVTGVVHVDNVASFAEYYAKHASPASEVFADEKRRQIVAVLDAPASETSDTDARADWRQHLLILTPPFTDAWKTWAGKDRQMMSQTDFAEFIEDNLADIAPEPVSAADMLLVATTFQRHDKVQFASSTILDSGERLLRYEETVDARAGDKGSIKVPAKFKIGVTIFDDAPHYGIECRFRHRVKSGALSMAYLLDRPADKMRDAFRSVVDLAAEQTGATIMRGSGYEG